MGRKTGMKIYLCVLIVFALLLTTGVPVSAEEGADSAETQTAVPTIATTVPTTESTTVQTTVATTVPTAESTTVQTTVSTTVPTTESTTVQTTAATTVPTTESTTVQTTVATTVPTTESTMVQTTVATTVPTTESTTMQTTVATTVPTAETTRAPTPEETTPVETVPTMEESAEKPGEKMYADTGKSREFNREELGETREQVQAKTSEESITPLSTEEPVPVSIPAPQYLSGGTAESYPLQSVDARTVYPGSTAFVYEKIKIRITEHTYATSIVYMSGSANPSALNTIQADANGVINLLDVSVGGYTGAYRIYDGSTWTGGYLYLWQPDLILRAEYAGSTDSVDGKAVSKSSSIHYIIDSPKVGPSGIGAKAKIIVTTPVGGQTTMLGTADLSAINISSVRVTTQDISLADTSLRGGTYTSRAEWVTPQVFASYAKKSNVVTYYLGSSTGITVTAGAETVVRSNPFTVTVSGLPNTPYLISLDAGRSPVPQLIAGQPGVVRGSENPKVSIGGSEKPVQLPDGAATDPNSWGVVTTDASGKRVVQYSTGPVNGRPVEEGSCTVRINDITDYGTSAGKGSDNDRVSIRITVGGMTMTAGSSASYYLGEEIRLSGTNTDSDTTYLFLTGPNLNTGGVSLSSMAPGEFTKAAVKSDHTWEYRWDTGATGLDTGTYTVYAVSTMNDRTHLSGTQYATCSIQLKQPGLSTSTSSFAAAKGDTVHITGTVTGSPSSVALFIFGSNYYERRTVPVNSGTYDYRMAIPESMAVGEYFLVVEHPMTDGRFGVQEIHQDSKTILAMAAAGGGTQSSFIVDGPGRLQGSQAANALVKMLASPYIDDIYTTLTLTVQAPYIAINPVGTKYTGESFTVSGRTNLAPEDKLLVEVSPSAFVPSGKNNPVSSYGTSGTVGIVKDSPDNTWNFLVDGSGFAADSYTVKVSGVSVSTSSSATFDVVPRPTDTPTPQPTVTEPPTTVPTTAVPTPTEASSAMFGYAGLILCGAAALAVRRR